MISRDTYFRMKKKIKMMSKKNLLDIADNAMLNEQEKNILLDFYDNKTVTEICMNRCMTPPTYNALLKNIFCKIIDYQNTH